MSSGNRKSSGLTDRGEDLYNRALDDAAFQARLKQRYSLNQEYRIPYLGGYSKDGRIIYIDRDFDLRNLIPALEIHEHWEKTALDVWRYAYPAAHELATYAEHRFVIDKLHMRPVAYERLLRPYIKRDEAETHVRFPSGFDFTPYNSPSPKGKHKGHNPFG
jgi:hypothetical protein